MAYNLQREFSFTKNEYRFMPAPCVLSLLVFGLGSVMFIYVSSFLDSVTNLALFNSCASVYRILFKVLKVVPLLVLILYMFGYCKKNERLTFGSYIAFIVWQIIVILMWCFNLYVMIAATNIQETFGVLVIVEIVVHIGALIAEAVMAIKHKRKTALK